MPVWHANTKELVESGELELVGIVQEQHPDRAELFARWQGFDWPVLWDPFDLLGVERVPLSIAIDEAGVVVATGLDPRKVREPDGLLAAFGGVPSVGERPPLPPLPPAVTTDLDDPGRVPEGSEAARRAALATLMFQHWNTPGPALGRAFDRAVDRLERVAAAEDATPEDRFRVGVAHRLRFDSPFARPGDFQAALDHWNEALHARPGQYIWRRRIQQWGPRLDKPYPFYDWVGAARADLLARGEEPPTLSAPLSGAEVAGGSKLAPTAEERTEPDPTGDVPLDVDDRVRLETAVALHTGHAASRVRMPRGTCRVHLTLVPDAERDVRFEDAGGPTEVWLEVPEGWSCEGRRLGLAPVRPNDPSAPRGVDFELLPPPEVVAGARLAGYALYPVCVGEDGTCDYLRRDFVLEIPAAPGEPPAPPGPPPSDDRSAADDDGDGRREGAGPGDAPDEGGGEGPREGGGAGDEDDDKDGDGDEGGH